MSYKNIGTRGVDNWWDIIKEIAHILCYAAFYAGIIWIILWPFLELHWIRVAIEGMVGK